MEDTTKKTWQEELREIVEKVPEKNRQRVHDFLVGCIATMQEESTAKDTQTLNRPILFDNSTIYMEKRASVWYHIYVTPTFLSF